jgi:hypothetical protein
MLSCTSAYRGFSSCWYEQRISVVPEERDTRDKVRWFGWPLKWTSVLYPLVSQCLDYKQAHNNRKFICSSMLGKNSGLQYQLCLVVNSLDITLFPHFTGKERRSVIDAGLLSNPVYVLLTCLHSLSIRLNINIFVWWNLAFFLQFEVQML